MKTASWTNADGCIFQLNKVDTKTLKGAMTNYLKSDAQLLKEGLTTTKGGIWHQNKYFIKNQSTHIS